MQIQVVDDGGATAKVVLTGKLDIAGADVVALPLATLSGSKNVLTIDMAGVTVISSIGIRQLVSVGKVLIRRGGRLELLNSSDMVTEVLVTTGVSDFMTLTRTNRSVGAP
jgi:anti-anti-sigma factor